MVHKDEVVKAIQKLLDSKGYRLISKSSPYPRRKERESLYLTVQPEDTNEGPILNLAVSLSHRFLVTFEGAKKPEYFDDLNQMLNGISQRLKQNRVLS